MGATTMRPPMHANYVSTTASTASPNTRSATVSSPSMFHDASRLLSDLASRCAHAATLDDTGQLSEGSRQQLVQDLNALPEKVALMTSSPNRACKSSHAASTGSNEGIESEKSAPSATTSQHVRSLPIPSSKDIHEALVDWKPKHLKACLEQCGVSHQTLLEKNELVNAVAQCLSDDEKLRLQMLTFCEICCRWLRTEEFWPLTCSHLCCETCLGRHLTVEAEKMLNHAKRHAIPCLFPECTTPISVTTAAGFCQQVRSVWSDLGRREKLLQNAKHAVLECPQPQCPGIAYMEPGRRTAMCFICEHQWQVSDADDDSAQPHFAANVRTCPKCNALIEKVSGCDHMQCTKCGRQFNWSGAQFANSDHTASSSNGSGGNLHPPWGNDECKMS